MNRTVNLLACLGILVAGITLEAPADDGPSGATGKPCCGDVKTPSSDVGTPQISECLQVLVYEDEAICLWLADVYYDSSCTDTPEEDYIWTLPGESAPQTCAGTPGCLHPPSSICPGLQHPLPTDKGYLDVLDSLVHYPGLPANRTWNPKDALVDLGELKTTFVKVKNAGGQYFAVRLAAGICEMQKIRFPAGAFPAKPKIANLKILIGFETEMDAADVDKLPEAIPTPWKRYTDCPTAFVLNVGNNEYHVTTTAANPIKVSPKVAKSVIISKPIGKRTEKKAVEE